MFSKLAVTVLTALAGLHIVAAGPVASAYTCPEGRYLYCCAGDVPGGAYAASCSRYNKETGCGGEVKCCVYSDAFHNGFGCSAPTSA